MSKPPSKRTLKKANASPRMEIRLMTLVGHVLSDVSRYLPEQVYKDLYFALYETPQDFRHCLDLATLTAESSLADGGFEAYSALRQLQAIVKKNIDWYAATPSERSERAIDGFSADNEACRKTNIRLGAARRNTIRGKPTIQVLNLAKSRIREVIGVVTQDVYVRCLESADFGPGAPYVPEMGWTESRSLYYKIAGNQTMTREALPHVACALALCDGWKKFLLLANAEYQIVDEELLSSVFKNADIDRTIGQQPSCNLYIQKGVGAELTECLRSVGIFLTDQGNNHRAARQGSLLGQTATVDLKSASNRNARALVEWLFPESWYQLMSEVSLAWTKYPDGTIHRLEMFSTMGNAITFPLETLIFYAITYACCVMSGEDTRLIRVYGDDIVCPVGALGLLFETLRYVGHIPNVEKTHVWGPFRESCGRDFVGGFDVRPVYLDKMPTTDLEVMSLHNRLTLAALVPLPRTIKYLRNRARDLTGPPDLGSSLDEAYSSMTGSSTLAPYRVYKGRVFQSDTAKAKKRLGVALAEDSYFVADPPPPAGYCSSNQSWYYVFKGFSRRAKPLDLETPEWLAYAGVLYGVQMLSLTRVSGDLSDLRFPSSESTIFTPEKFCFWWSSIEEVRARLFRKRAV